MSLLFRSVSLLFAMLLSSGELSAQVCPRVLTEMGKPKTSEIEMGGVKVPIVQRDSIVVLPTPDPNLTRLRIQSIIWLGQLQSDFRKTIEGSGQLPGSDCHHHYDFSDFSLNPSAPKALGHFKTDYDNWSCCIRCQPCPTWNDLGRMCDIKNRNFSATGRTNMTMSPVIQSGNVFVNVVSSTNASSNLPADVERLGSILFGEGGLITIALGKQLLKEFRSFQTSLQFAVSKEEEGISNEIVKFSPTMAAFKDGNDVRYDGSGSHINVSPPQLVLQIVMDADGPKKERTNCFIRDLIIKNRAKP